MAAAAQAAALQLVGGGGRVDRRPPAPAGQRAVDEDGVGGHVEAVEGVVGGHDRLRRAGERVAGPQQARAPGARAVEQRAAAGGRGAAGHARDEPDVRRRARRLALVAGHAEEALEAGLAVARGGVVCRRRRRTTKPAGAARARRLREQAKGGLVGGARRARGGGEHEHVAVGVDRARRAAAEAGLRAVVVARQALARVDGAVAGGARGRARGALAGVGRRAVVVVAVGHGGQRLLALHEPAGRRQREQ